MEEERRLCYVAITRAKKTLTICHAKQRMIFGRTSAALPSRFLKELPESEILKKGSSVSVKGFNTGFGSSYISHKPSFSDTVQFSSFTKSQTQNGDTKTLDLSKGDMVQHTAFGKGMVLSVVKMGGDALLEVAFDKIGTKKLMAKTASAHMKKL